MSILSGTTTATGPTETPKWKLAVFFVIRELKKRKKKKFECGPVRRRMTGPLTALVLPSKSVGEPGALPSPLVLTECGPSPRSEGPFRHLHLWVPRRHGLTSTKHDFLLLE